MEEAEGGGFIHRAKPNGVHRRIINWSATDLFTGRKERGNGFEEQRKERVEVLAINC